MKKMLLIAALLLAADAHAQTYTVLQKCRAVDGSVRFTNTGCKSNEKMLDARAYYNGPERDNSPQLAQERAEMDRRNREYRQSQAVPVYEPPSQPTERDKRKERCAAARKVANDARGKGWDNSYLRQLDKTAVDACFGL